MRLATQLVLITVGCAITAFLVAMFAMLASEHDRAARELQHGAETAARILSNSYVGLAPGAMLDTRFPDWDALAIVTRPDGSCARLIHPDGRPWRSDCRGMPGHADHVPAWFSQAYATLFTPAQQVPRDIVRDGRPLATLTFSRDGQAEIQRAWAETRRLAGLTSVLLVSLCLALLVTVGRTLKPLGAIVTQLEALARGEHDARLGRLAVAEFDRIARAGDALAATLAAHAAERERFSLRLLEAQDGERRQLARDLHDEFGQHLTALAATTATVARRTDAQDAPLADALERAQASIAHLHGLVRDLLGRLRPPGLDELGLVGAINALVGDWNRRCAGRPRLEVRCDPACEMLPRALAAEILRVVQEATTNAIRHAGATVIAIELRRDAASCTLEVCDDGRGAPDETLGERGGHGLTNLRERAAACAGRLEFLHPPSGGFGLRLVIPLRAAGPTP